MKYRIGLVIMIISLTVLLSGCNAAEEMGISLNGLLGQIISFGLLLGILILVAYKPITRMLEERSQKIKESLEQAELVKKESSEAEQRIQEQIVEARKQGQEIVAQAEQVGERMKDEAREQARKDAENIVAKAQAEIRAERNELVTQLRGEFVEVAIAAAEKVIEKALDKEKHKQLIEKTLQESGSLKKES